MIKKTLPKNMLLAHLFLLTAGVIWGAGGPVIKITLGYVPPATFLFLRFLIVCLLVLPYTIYELSRTKVNPKDYFNLFILGLLSQGSLLIVFYAYKYTSVLDVTIIGVIGAILTVYLGHIFYKEKVDRKLTLGLVLASVGTLIVILEPILNNGQNHDLSKKILGNFLTIIYTLFWISFLLFSKMTMGEKSKELKKDLKLINITTSTKAYSASLITNLSFYVGLVSIIPFAIWEALSPNYTFDITSIGAIGLFGILYMAIFSSIVAYIAYQYGLKYAKVSDTALHTYLQPILALPFAYFLLGEVPNKFMLIGATIISIGVLVAEVRKS